jgi:hypothetical protein
MVLSSQHCFGKRTCPTVTSTISIQTDRHTIKPIKNNNICSTNDHRKESDSNKIE